MLLATREPIGSPVPSVRKADCGESGVNARPDRLWRHGVVLRPERDIVAGAGHDQLSLWILEHEPDAISSIAWVEPVHG